MLTAMSHCHLGLIIPDRDLLCIFAAASFSAAVRLGATAVMDFPIAPVVLEDIKQPIDGDIV